MATSNTIKNRCANIRVQIDDHVYRVFSIIVDHPKEIDEDAWRPMELNGARVLVDEATIDLLSGKACQWLYSPDDESDEPTIIAAEISVGRTS